ncbi:MAG: hypothetical protein H6Q04_2256, partial [Acidobacteria bacterium]|nr:hypothetical protein [Acidobacteriota bacterium]
MISLDSEVGISESGIKKGAARRLPHLMRNAYGWKRINTRGAAIAGSQDWHNP